MRALDVVLVVALLLVPVGIFVLVFGYNRRRRRLVREGAARAGAELGLTAEEDRVTGYRRGQLVEVRWRGPGGGTTTKRPHTVCAARFEHRSELGLVASTPRRAPTTERVGPELFASARTAAAQGALPEISRLMLAAARELTGLMNIEVDNAGVEIFLDDHIYDPAILEPMLDRSMALAQEISAVLGRAQAASAH
jgi:hypothetical protein